MLARLRSQEVAYAALTMVATSVVAALVLHLWDASLSVPFAPSGDGYFALMQIKGVIDNGWVLSNPHLGAPFGQDLHDFAGNRELLQVLVVRVLGLFSSDAGTVYNLYYLLSFPLIGLASYVVMRWLRISPPVAVAMSVLYAIAPYHFRHSTFLWAYYTVPLAAYLILAIYSSEPLFERRQGQVGWPLRWASRRSLLTVGVAALLAVSSFYYAGFAVILVVIAAVIAFVVSRRRSVLAAGAAIAVTVVVVGAVVQLPDLIYRADHGRNEEVGKRSASDSQLYSTNILQLVIPVPQHRIGKLNTLSERWRADSRIDGEPTHLGLIAALGFVWLIVVAVVAAAGASGRFIRDLRHRHLAMAALTTLLVGTTGGVSGLIAYGITPQLRTWTRLAIFIAFFGLAAVGLLLDAGGEVLRRRGVRLPAAAVAAILVAICAVGTLDQTTSLIVPAYGENAAKEDSDAGFASAIEQRLGGKGMVLQLPYVSFPESKDVGGTGPYEHVRPYLQTDALDWSFGAMKGRATDWEADTSGAPPDQLAPAAAAAGFDGIYVDRAGYPDLGAELEAGLREEVGGTPLISADSRFSFFDLRPYARRLRAELAPAELQALADATLRPVRTDWSGGFSGRQEQGLDSSHWALAPNASLTLVNPSNRGRSTELFVKLTRAGGDPAQVAIAFPDGTSERVDVPPEGTDVERTLQVPPGSSTIRFTVDGDKIEAPVGEGSGYLQLLGWRLTPTVP